MKFQRAKNPSSGGRLRPLRGFSRPRLGLTLIEILMTIFVLAIGLLGVAALLPVGTFQMRQGQIAQRTAEIGSGALDTIEASGINHPGRWSKLAGAFPDGAPFDAVDITDLNNPVRIACPVASDSPSGTSLTTTANTAAKVSSSGTTLVGCLVEFVRGQSKLLTQQGNIVTASPPMFTLDTPGFNNPTPVIDDVFVIKRYEPFAIDPLYVAAHGADANPRPTFAPNIERLTLLSGVFGEQDPAIPDVMQTAAAEAIFQATDDLLFTPGTDTEGLEDESKLPEPPWPPKVDAEGRVSPRPSLGNYSWLATFVPVEQSGSYRDGQTYTVSVAVFYKRPLGLPVSATPDPETDPQWTYAIAIPSIATATISGTAKSDTTLPPTFLDIDSDGTYDQEAGDESHIKSGQWGLVTYLVGTAPRARWYRLGSVGKPSTSSGTVDETVMARLIGPDFPAGATNPQITFFEGLKGVFERTIRVPELPIGDAQ